MCTVVDRNTRSLEVLPSIDNPLNGGDDEDDGKGHNTVVHARPTDRQGRWEEEQHCCDNGVH